MPSIFNLFLGLFILLILLAVAARLVIHYKKGNLQPWLSRSLRKSFRLFWVMGVLGLALLFFNYEGAPYLGSRFWYLLWLVMFVAWVGYIVWHVRSRWERDTAAAQQKFQVNKYL